MGWLIGNTKPQEPELLEYFFTVLGRSLYVANMFEQKCSGLLNWARMVKAFELLPVEESGDFDIVLELVNAMKQKMLAGTISELKTKAPIKQEDIEQLALAKDARNYIAHEGGRIGYIWNATASDLEIQLDELRLKVIDLAKGDNIVSGWVHEIEFKYASAYGYKKYYPDVLEDWVFSGEPSCFDFGYYWYKLDVEPKLKAEQPTN